MAKKQANRSPRVYRVGIDVGTNSVGLAAVEVDDKGAPVSILSAMSHLHDSGVLEHKTATTRLAAAGVARRMRRLRRRRSKRLARLEQFFKDLGWHGSSDMTDPYHAWRARAALVTEYIPDEHKRHTLLVDALRHMARHRGWRNPYVRVASLYESQEPSPQFLEFKERVEQRTGRDLDDDLTVAELAIIAIEYDHHIPLRMGKTQKLGKEKDFSYMGGKLMQSDNANEIHAYATAQGLDHQLVRQILDLVFAAESPRGSHVSRIGKDPLTGDPRAPKASDAFQRYVIAAALANVRISDDHDTRALTVFERNQVFDYLLNAKAGTQPTWAEISKLLGFSRSQLAGVASLDGEGEERLPLRPPLHRTEHVLQEAGRKVREVVTWWQDAEPEARDALIALLVDGQREESEAGDAAWLLLDSLDEDALQGLEGLNLPAGRAAYSLSALRALSERILSSIDDVHEARKHVFGVDDSWRPPVEAINEQTGNPAVDRVTKTAARWLYSAASHWGPPQQVTIEHVRDAFNSESEVRRREREMQSRFAANEKIRLQIKAGEKEDGRVSFADVRRHQAITRQKGQCAYCGETVTFHTSEMDHIIPRRGVGSTNTRANLVAVCVPCNRSKSNIPFAVWAKRTSRSGVSVEEAIERTKFWTRDQGTSVKSWQIFLADVRERLLRTDEDPEIDGRSIESVAWMANELRERIEGHFADSGVPVSVYHGGLTAAARGVTGIEGKIPFIGGGAKTRFDRRHHAVDAAVVALLNPSVAQTLAQRNNLRIAHRFNRHQAQDWREFFGYSEKSRERFHLWREHMDQLGTLINKGFEKKTIPVTQNLRLRIGDGKVHEETIAPFVRRRLSESFSIKQIDAASTPALWTALTRCEDFDPEHGLPENPNRRIRVRGDHFGPKDYVELFDKPRAALAVRGGWAQLGDSIHHARLYRWEQRGRLRFGMLRVFSADLHAHRNQNLFTVDPKPAWISMRAADPLIGKADLGELEYVGWLVKGDEVVLRSEGPQDSAVQRLNKILGTSITHWVIEGFESPVRLKLGPRYLASEGLERIIERKKLTEEEQKFIETLFKRSWRVSVNVLFSRFSPVIIRRDALGRPRWRTRAGLPVSWQAG